MKDFLNELESDLAAKGAPTNFIKFGYKHSPLEALVNGATSALPFTDILLRYLPLVDPKTKEMIARALTIKGNKKAAKPLINLFVNDTSLSDANRWAIGNALNIINDKDSYSDIFQICKNQSFGMARQMLMDILARMKTEEAFQLLITSLKDATVITHALTSLAKLGDIRAIPYIDQPHIDGNSFLRKQKKKTLETLKKKN